MTISRLFQVSMPTTTMCSKIILGTSIGVGKNLNFVSVIKLVKTFNTRTSQLQGLPSRLVRIKEWLSVGSRFIKSQPLGKNCKAAKYRSLGLLPAFAFLDRFKKIEHPTLSPEILASIPKEVFKKDILKKRKRRFIILWVIDKIVKYIRLVLRLARILLTFGPLLCLYPVTYCGSRAQLAWWKLLLFACECSGPTYIKLGQWASTRRDLFSPTFCEMFSKLHNSTSMHSWSATRRKLTKAFGKRWSKILVRMDKRPCGSGCISQVHKGYMKADMIPDESIVDEIMENILDDENVDEEMIDYAEGLEIIGFHHVRDQFEDMVDDIEEKNNSAASPAASKQPEPTVVPADAGAVSTPADVPAESPALTETPPAPAHTPALTGTPPAPDQPCLLPVAVKVLHPGVYRNVQRDLSILRFLSRFVEWVVPSLKWISVRECMQEFSDLMIKQIDLRFEAECLEQFVENFQDIPNIRFPRPVWPYCKHDVLIETFEEGEPITDYLGAEPAAEGLREKLAEFGADALLRMIFVDNFIHGDLHPGNLLVQNAKQFVDQDEAKLILVDIGDTLIVSVTPVENPLRLVMLDVGIATSLSEVDLQNFKDVFTAVVLGEGEKVAELMLQHSRCNQCTDVELFKTEVCNIVSIARESGITLGKIQVGQLLADVFGTLSRHRVKMESNFASVMVAMFVLEGLGRSLHPDLDLMDRAKVILLPIP